MMTVLGMSLRRAGTTAVTAFTISTTSRRTAVGTRAFLVNAEQQMGGMKNRNSDVCRSSSKLSGGSWTASAPFASRKCARMSSSLHQSTTAAAEEASTSKTTSELEKALEVTHPAYEVVRRDVVNEYGAYCTLFKHVKSGAEVLSVSNDDDNKVFGITFRTPPHDSTGVPHILEHSVLCGSRKYTTKDPFVHLLKGSLQTFLNAMTWPGTFPFIGLYWLCK